MSITTNISTELSYENIQQYTLVVQDNETGQKNIVSYNDSAILTTDLDALMDYTSNLVLHYGKSRTYTICTVTAGEAVTKFIHKLVNKE